MKAAVLYEIGKGMAIEEVRLTGPKDREVLLRITAAGACRSDLSTARSKTIPLEGINDAFRELEAGIDTRTVITFA